MSSDENLDLHLIILARCVLEREDLILILLMEILGIFQIKSEIMAF